MSRSEWDKALAAYLARPPVGPGRDGGVTVTRTELTGAYVVIPLARFVMLLRDRS